MKKGCFLACAFGVLAVLSGCYQIHSDDDLRSVPVTNNPNIVPASSYDGPARFIPA